MSTMNYTNNTLDGQRLLITFADGEKLAAPLYAWPVLQVGFDPSGTVIPLTLPARPADVSNFRSLTVDSTAQAIKASAGTLQAVNIVNRHGAVIAVKFYNIAAGSVNPASSVPVLTVLVPATDSRLIEFQKYFGTAISVRAVTDLTDTGTTAPATLPIIEAIYK